MRTRVGMTLSGLLIGCAVWASAQDAKPADVKPAAAPQNPSAVPVPGAPAAPAAKPVDPATAPKLTMNMEKWDFGSKWYGEKCESELVIKNEGKGPLTIVDIKTSCGCTVAKPKSGGTWQNKVLQVGESEAAILTYNTKKMVTKVSQTITIQSNDPERPSYAFQVMGEVKQVFACAPADRITFPRVEKDAQLSQTIEMTSNMDKPVNLKLKPIPANSKYEVKLETVEEGKKYKLTAATKPPLEMGANQLNVELETGVPENPTMTIPVSAFVSPRVSVSPPKLYVSPKVTQPFTKMVRMVYTPEKPVKITKVVSSHELIKAEVKPPAQPPAAGSASAYHEIVVSLPSGKDIPTKDAKITIETDDAQYPKFDVDIVVRDSPAVATRPNSAPVQRPIPPSGLASPVKPTDAPKPDAPKPAEPAKPAEPTKP